MREIVVDFASFHPTLPLMSNSGNRVKVHGTAYPFVYIWLCIYIEGLGF